MAPHRCATSRACCRTFCPYDVRYCSRPRRATTRGWASPTSAVTRALRPTSTSSSSSPRRASATASSIRTGWMRPSATSAVIARRATSRRTGSKPESVTRPGVSSTTTSQPVACSNARALRPLAADHAALHAVVGEQHGRDGPLRGVADGDALDRGRDERAGARLGVAPHRLDVGRDAARVLGGQLAVEDLERLRLGLGRREARRLRQPGAGLRRGGVRLAARGLGVGGGAREPVAGRPEVGLPPLEASRSFAASAAGTTGRSSQRRAAAAAHAPPPPRRRRRASPRRPPRVSGSGRTAGRC